MKIKSIFKKKSQNNTASAEVTKLEKNQLSQINGGGDVTLTSEPSNLKYTGGGGKAQGQMG